MEEIDTERQKVRVVVSMFGRETPVELDLDQSSPSDPAAVPRAWEEWSSAPSNHIFIMEVL